MYLPCTKYAVNERLPEKWIWCDRRLRLFLSFVFSVSHMNIRRLLCCVPFLLPGCKSQHRGHRAPAEYPPGKGASREGAGEAAQPGRFLRGHQKEAGGSRGERAGPPQPHLCQTLEAGLLAPRGRKAAGCALQPVSLRPPEQPSG